MALGMLASARMLVCLREPACRKMRPTEVYNHRLLLQSWERQPARLQLAEAADMLFNNTKLLEVETDGKPVYCSC